MFAANGEKLVREFGRQSSKGRLLGAEEMVEMAQIVDYGGGRNGDEISDREKKHDADETPDGELVDDVKWMLRQLLWNTWARFCLKASDTSVPPVTSCGYRRQMGEWFGQEKV